MPVQEKNMPACEVVGFIGRLQWLGIEIWIDGGWGVDVLLGRQTRPHRDLDIVILDQDFVRARAMLEESRFRDIPRDDTSPWNFILGDDQGHEIDFHVIGFDAKGNGILGPPERGSIYPAGSLTGCGTIAGVAVQCIEPRHLIAFHTGYSLRETDFRDVSALCERFGIELPPEYARFRTPLT